MFRRRREDSSPRPPASSAWWTSPDEAYSDARQPPPLPTSDPFGGWPAFPPDAAPGHPSPVDGWGLPTMPGPANPEVPRDRPFLGDGAAGTERMPLLTHEEQSISDEFARFGSAGELSDYVVEAESWGAPPASDHDTRHPTGSRGRIGRARDATQPPPAEAAPASTSFESPAAELAPRPPAGLDVAVMAEAMEAAALAGAFAADYLSWDESNPTRRGVVLMQYLPSDVVGDASLLGWSGSGRQRSEFALPGAVRPDGEGRLIVDVRVRITPYRAVGQSAEPASEPEDQMEVAGVPSAAPAPTARGWKSLDSYWVRLAVPVIRDQNRLVVDTWDEQLGDAPDDDLDLYLEDQQVPATSAAPSGRVPGDTLPTDVAPADVPPAASPEPDATTPEEPTTATSRQPTSRKTTASKTTTGKARTARTTAAKDKAATTRTDATRKVTRGSAEPGVAR